MSVSLREVEVFPLTTASCFILSGLSSDLQSNLYLSIIRSDHLIYSQNWLKDKTCSSHFGEKKKATNKISKLKGSGCGSVSRAVASDSRGPRFESRHRQKFKLNIFTVSCVERTKIKKKEAGKGPFKKNIWQWILLLCHLTLQ